jgi:hypothetical protein
LPISQLTPYLPFYISILHKLILNYSPAIKETSDEIHAFYNKHGYENNLNADQYKSDELVFEGGIGLEHTFSQSSISSRSSA